VGLAFGEKPTRHRSRGIEFKRQAVQEYLSGETLHGLAKRHDVSRQLIRVWIEKYEAGELNDDAQAAVSSSSMRPASPRWNAWSARRPSNLSF
jgi:transposase-like protein